MEFITKSTEETKSLGRKIGASLKGGETLALVGELGSGKTAFVQGLAEGLGIKSKIPSPTFILQRTYNIPLKTANSELQALYHLDLYRFEDNIENEVRNLGIEDVWGRRENIVVVEWADKLTRLWPKNTQWINFETLSENARKITFRD